jgi:predicted lipoprotein with Yx(FWY)xxD motif
VSHRRIAIISGAAAAASFLAVGTGTAQAASPYQYSPAQTPTAAVSSGHAPKTAAQPTVHTVTTRVDGRSERILVAANGLPLYYFRPDTAKQSKVNGALAQLWPPVLSTRPSASGVNGKVESSRQSNGRQVSYNGHFLYTFVDDSPGHVTGQGVSNFFVATPNIRALGASVKAVAPAPSTSRGYAY